MIYSKNKNFLFLAVAKTGTTTIEKHLSTEMRNFSNKDYDMEIYCDKRDSPYLHKHSTYSEVISLFDNCERPYIFGFVRNPFDRVVSWFNYMTKGLNSERAKQNSAKTNGINYLSGDFTEFCIHAPPWVFMNQYLYFIDSLGRVAADKVCRFEKLSQDFDNVAFTLGIEPMNATNKLNVSSDGRHYSEYYESRSRNIVQSRYAIDLKYFDYSFYKF